MGTLTNTELQDEIRYNLGNRTDLDTRLQRFLNLAQIRVARLHDFDELKALMTNTTNYVDDSTDKFLVVPTRLRKVFSLRLIDGSNSRKLDMVTPRMWDRVIPKPDYYSRGRPSKFVRWGDNLEFWRVPDAEYDLELRCTLWPTPFSTGSQTSDLDQKDDALIALGTSLAFTSLRRMDKANEHWAIFRSIMKESTGEDVIDPDLEITPGPGSTSSDVGLSKGYDDPFVRSVETW